MYYKVILFISISLSLLHVSACGKKAVETSVKTGMSQNILHSANISVPLRLVQKSDSRKTNEGDGNDSKKTDATKSVAILLDESFEQNDHQTFWDNCLVLYSVSPHATDLIRSKFNTSDDIKIAFVSLKAYDSKLQTAGMYFPENKVIYLDNSIKTNYEGCHILLHELYHRFDEAAQTGRTDFDVEFPAYYHQTYFSGELFQVPEFSILTNSAPRIHTVQTKDQGITQLVDLASVAKSIAKITGTVVNKDMVKNYPKFPWENPIQTKPEIQATSI